MWQDITGTGSGRNVGRSEGKAVYLSQAQQRAITIAHRNALFPYMQQSMIDPIANDPRLRRAQTIASLEQWERIPSQNTIQAAVQQAATPDSLRPAKAAGTPANPQAKQTPAPAATRKPMPIHQLAPRYIPDHVRKLGKAYLYEVTLASDATGPRKNLYKLYGKPLGDPYGYDTVKEARDAALQAARAMRQPKKG